MQAIVLAAGKGTRMWPLCTLTPKPLLSVAGRPLLRRLLEGLRDAGVAEAVVVVAAGDRKVPAAVRSWKLGLKVRFARQDRPGGTGHAVAAASRHTQGDCLLAMADAAVDAAVLARLARAKGFVVAAARVPDGSRYGVLSTKGPRVTGLREKPGRAAPALVNTGLYRVPAEAVAAARSLKPSRRGELEFTDVVRAWARRGLVRWMPARGWLDVGSPWDLLAAQEALLGPALDADAKARPGQEGAKGGTAWLGPGRVHLEEGARVLPGTYVEGDVWLGAGSVVGPHAYLRGPVTLGAGCKVGAACELKASVLLDGAKVPHLSYVGDSVIGEGCNLGAGTIVANLRHDGANVLVSHRGKLVDTGRHKFGAIVGDGAKTGIGSRLNPGTLLGPGAWLPAGAVVKGTVEATSVKRR